MKKILVINGSPAGKKGNCARFISTLPKLEGAKLSIVHLATERYSSAFKKKIAKADGFVFVTGTYWDSWGSPLQKLLEDMTDLEGEKAVMGKPAAVFVLMHSVGGKGVLSRLQGVLSTFGCLIPPMSGMVYSLVSDIALSKKNSHAADFWQKEDAELILLNLIKATDIQINWADWPVDKKDPRRLWL